MKRGYACCPAKCRHFILLGLREDRVFHGPRGAQQRILYKAILFFPEEWRMALERIKHLVGAAGRALTHRAAQGRSLLAFRLCFEVIQRRQAPGRLWTCLIHLAHESDFPVSLTHRVFGGDAAMRFFRLALRYVAKSGEVWCEGARIFLDPTCSYFSPQHARIALNFAAFFTPQYGDVFIEVAVAPPTHPQGIRLHMDRQRRALCRPPPAPPPADVAARRCAVASSLYPQRLPLQPQLRSLVEPLCCLLHLHAQ